MTAGRTRCAFRAGPATIDVQPPATQVTVAPSVAHLLLCDLSALRTDVLTQQCPEMFTCKARKDV